MCFRLSCELFGWPTILGFLVNFLGDWLLPNLKHWKSFTAQMVGEWGKCQLGRCTNQRWGAGVRTHQNYFLPQWFVAVVSEEKTDNNWVLPWHHCFLWFKNPIFKIIRKKDKVLLNNNIALYTRLTYVEPDQNILEHFCT